MIILAVALVVIIPLSSMAVRGVKDVDDVYYSKTDPVDAPVPGAPWTAYNDGDSIEVGPADTEFWIGIENLYIEENYKKLVLIIKGSNIDLLNFESVTGFDESGDSTTIQANVLGTPLVKEDIAVYTFRFIPQPKWEKIKFTKASGTVVIRDIDAGSQCQVPSLTTAGLVALVVLLIISAIIVIYRRRRAVTA
jgi:hypothetical protein